MASAHWITWLIFAAMKKQLTLALKGMAMGIAEIIPGVSGGTIAFITGIYEELLLSIRGILSPEPIAAWRKDGLGGAWRAVNGAFLLTLLSGMVAGVVIATFTITGLLERYPPVVWAFFFGLIIASAIYIGRQIDRWRWQEVVLLLLGLGGAYLLTISPVLEGSTSPVIVFLAGAVAISALILPGISGSFILLLLGMYTVVLPALRGLLSGDTAYAGTVFFFGLGCLTGLALFSRLLTWTFRRFPNPTFAVLTGFMLGSLPQLWPWRRIVSTRIDSAGEVMPVQTAPVWAADYTQGEPYVAAVVIALICGLAIVFVLERLGRDEGVEEVIKEEEIL